MCTCVGRFQFQQPFESFGGLVHLSQFHILQTQIAERLRKVRISCQRAVKLFYRFFCVAGAYKIHCPLVTINGRLWNPGERRFAIGSGSFWPKMYVQH